MQDTQLTYDQRLDSLFLESIYENDKEDAAFGFEQFLNCYSSQLKELEQSFEKGDLTMFRQYIHKIKPTFSFVGLTNVTAMAATIEKKCDDTGKIEAISESYSDFKTTLYGLIPVVKEEYNRLNT